MANKKISELPSASVVNQTDELEIVQSGVSYRATINKISSLVTGPQGNPGIQGPPGPSGTPAGAAYAIQYNNSAAFGGITPGLPNTVLISTGTGSVPAFSALAASMVASGVFSTARLGTGTPDSTKYLRGDGAWTKPQTFGNSWDWVDDASSLSLQVPGGLGYWALVNASGSDSTVVIAGNGPGGSVNMAVDGASMLANATDGVTLSTSGALSIALNTAQSLLVNGQGGVNGQVLTSNGPGSPPTWEDGGGAGGTTFGNGWNWDTTTNHLIFEFPNIGGTWFEAVDSGGIGQLFIGGMEDIEIIANNDMQLGFGATATLNASGLLTLSGGTVLLDATNSVTIDSDSVVQVVSVGDQTFTASAGNIAINPASLLSLFDGQFEFNDTILIASYKESLIQFGVDITDPNGGEGAILGVGYGLAIGASVSKVNAGNYSAAINACGNLYLNSYDGVNTFGGVFIGGGTPNTGVNTGGPIQLSAGSAHGIGANGGSISLIGGRPVNGGAGNGGSITLTGGGADVSGAGVTTGDGGSITFVGGSAGLDAGNGGDITLTGGAAPSGVAGKVVFGSIAKLKNLTVATLPAAAAGNSGSVAYVTDANATTRLSVVASGGANKVVVYSDGSNWLIL